MRQVAILGVAMTKFGVSEKTNLEMFAEAGLEAIARSHLEPKDMEALFFGNCLGDFEEGQLHMAPSIFKRISHAFGQERHPPCRHINRREWLRMISM